MKKFVLMNLLLINYNTPIIGTTLINPDTYNTLSKSIEIDSKFTKLMKLNTDDFNLWRTLNQGPLINFMIIGILFIASNKTPNDQSIIFSLLSKKFPEIKDFGVTSQKIILSMSGKVFSSIINKINFMNHGFYTSYNISKILSENNKDERNKIFKKFFIINTGDILLIIMYNTSIVYFFDSNTNQWIVWISKKTIVIIGVIFDLLIMRDTYEHYIYTLFKFSSHILNIEKIKQEMWVILKECTNLTHIFKYIEPKLSEYYDRFNNTEESCQKYDKIVFSFTYVIQFYSTYVYKSNLLPSNDKIQYVLKENTLRNAQEQQLTLVM